MILTAELERVVEPGGTTLEVMKKARTVVAGNDANVDNIKIIMVIYFKSGQIFVFSTMHISVSNDHQGKRKVQWHYSAIFLL